MAVDERNPLLPKHRASSESTPADKDESKASVSRALGIVVALFGVFLANADDSFVLATYGTIASQYQQFQDASWLLTAYNLGYCVALPVYANVSDITGGRKKLLLISYLLFGLGCLISAFGISLWQVIAGRVVAGVGGAGMIALVSVIVTDIVPLDRVASLRGYVNVVGITGRGFGGPIGGLLADTVGWRWSFLGQAPIALICFFLAGWHLPDNSSKAARLASNSDNNTSKTALTVRDVDFLGAALFTATTTSFLLVLNLGQNLSLDDPVIISMAVLCAVLGVAFILTEGFLAKRPLIPLRLIRINGVGIFCLVQILSTMARSSTFTNIAPYFIRTQDASNTTVANYLLLGGIGYGLGALLTGIIVGRTYRYKKLAVVSEAISILAYLLIALRWRHGTNIWESSYVSMAGLGLGMVLSTQFVGLSASAPRPQLATAISMYYLSQQLGEILGTSISTVLVRTDFGNTLQRQLGDGIDSKKIINGVLNDIKFADALPEAIQSVVRSSYLHSFQFAPLLSTGSSALALAFILYLGEQPLR